MDIYSQLVQVPSLVQWYTCTHGRRNNFFRVSPNILRLFWNIRSRGNVFYGGPNLMWQSSLLLLSTQAVILMTHEYCLHTFHPYLVQSHDKWMLYWSYNNTIMNIILNQLHHSAVDSQNDLFYFYISHLYLQSHLICIKTWLPEVPQNFM